MRRCLGTVLKWQVYGNLFCQLLLSLASCSRSLLVMSLGICSRFCINQGLEMF